MKNRMIKNYKPNRKSAKALTYKRIKYFTFIMLLILICEVIAYSLTWTLESQDSVKYMGIAIVSLHLFSTITFACIFDFGASNKLKKAGFQLPQTDYTIEQGHTFYAALRYVGISRFIINNIFTLLNVFVIIITFSI